METVVRVKDFIIDVNKLKQEDGKVKSKSNAKPKVEYSIVLENDMDFIIKRKTTKTDKDLVFLVSQDLFYIKNNIDDTVVVLDDINYKRQISAFCRGMDKWVRFEKVTWTENCYTDNLYDMFSNKNKRMLFKHGIKVSGYDRDIVVSKLKTNPKIVKYYFSKLSMNQYLFSAICSLCENYNYNNAKYLIDLIAERDTSLSETYRLEEMLNLSKVYKCDMNTLIEYIVRGLYTQGITGVDSNTHNCYRDYLSMNMQMYGKIKDKYPKHLKTDHDKLAMRFGYWKRHKDDLAVFEITEENRELEFKTKEYSIILPETGADIVEEGINQSHCVASYVERVAKGDTMILFMRETDNIEQSLITIEVRDSKVCQVRGYANRSTTKEEDLFIKKWAKAKNLTIIYKN